MTEWQDINDAPRDGTRILVARQQRGTSGPIIQKRVAIASWRHGGWDGGETTKLWHMEVCANHYIVRDDEIVGWQPLPEAPPSSLMVRR